MILSSNAGLGTFKIVFYFRKTNSLAVFSNKWMLKLSAGKCMVSKIGGKLDYKYQFQMIYFQESMFLILWRKSTKELASLNIVLLGLPSKRWKLCIYGRVIAAKVYTTRKVLTYWKVYRNVGCVYFSPWSEW